MRITNDLNRNNNGFQSVEPTFGAIYTKSSVKLLKKFIPEIIDEDGFKFAQKAINNLIQAGKRKDNLILKLKDIDDLGVGRLKVYAKRDTKQINAFRKIDINEVMYEKDSQEFEHLTSFVNSDSFVAKTNTIIDTNENLSQSQRVKEFIREKMQDFFLKIEHKIESLSDNLFCIDESVSKPQRTVFENIKTFTKNMFARNKNLYQYNDKQKEECEILSGMISKLPTLNNL